MLQKQDIYMHTQKKREKNNMLYKRYYSCRIRHKSKFPDRESNPGRGGESAES